MPRRPRIDRPGRLHHVLNRGQDRQRIFEIRADYRFFLSLLVRAVRAGRIRLHAYCLMPNHFHLLVESCDGNLSATMHWVQFRYAAYFNLTRDHVGHVFGGRFHSFPVTSGVYLLTLVRYIDRNPWKAKKRIHPLKFPWCSANHLARPGPRPRWLERSIIDEWLRGRLESGEDRLTAYQDVLRVAQLDSAGDDLVERRIAKRSRGQDELDALVVADPPALAAWLHRRTEESDAPTSPLALIDPASAMHAIEALRGEDVMPMLRTPTGRPRDARPCVEIGVLRDLVGLTYGVASELLGVGISELRARYAMHRKALSEFPEYVDVVARTMHVGLARAYDEEMHRVARLSVVLP